MKHSLLTGLTVVTALSGSLFFHGSVNAQSTAGPNQPDTAIALPGNGGDWVSPLNGAKIDGKYTEVVLPSNGPGIGSQASSNSLQVEHFGFNITPSTATIVGISVNMVGHDSVVNGDGVTANFQLIKDNSTVGSSYPAGAMQPSTDDTLNVAEGLWGSTWQPSDINNPQFGVNLVVKSKSSKAWVDGFFVTVTFQTSAGMPFLTQTSYSKILAYPNPSSGSVYVNPCSGQYMFEVFDVCGNLAYKNILDGPQVVNLSMLSNGVYFIRVNSDEISSSQKLIISK